ncbi:MAG: response regulator transcription factor [Pseudomonadota bacterium]|nr:response regulator transcription factor [Pseudomonadota bacterium]
MNAKPRILIADDHALFRAGVRSLLEAQTDWDVGGEAATGDEALRRMRNENWDAVLLDISLPDRTGIDILRQIRPHKPTLPILILSMYPEQQYAVNLLRAGASGYLTKDAVPEQVIVAVRTLLAGRKYISNEVAQLLAGDVDGDGRPLHSSLSEREFQIFCKLASGKSVGDIAEELHLSNKTVSTYRTRVLEKMNLASNADLTYYAIKNGLIQ